MHLCRIAPFVCAFALSHALIAQQVRAPAVSVRDVLEFQRITEVQLAPAGTAVAFVTRRAVLERKKNMDTLMVVDAGGGSTRILARADELSQVSWHRQGRSLYALRLQNEGRTIIHVDVETGQVDELWRAPGTIDQFAISPDGTRGVVALLRESSPEVAARRIDYGLVFEYGRHSARTILQREYSDIESAEILLVDLVEGSSRVVTRLPFDGFRHLRFVDRMAISTNNRFAALELVRAGKPTEGGPPFNHDIGVLDLQTGTYQEPLPQSIKTEMSPVWLGSTERLFFTTEGRGVIYDVASRALLQPAWTGLPENASWVTSSAYHPGEDAVYALARRALLRFSLKTSQVEQMATIYQPPSFSADFSKYAFVSEASNERPEVALFDRNTRRSTRLTELNPYLSNRSLGRVERLEVTNSFGVKTTGYLVHPVNYQPGRRYPVILASYGFQGKFILTAEWHTTFPAQTLAAEGYAVLLLNTPPVPSAQITAGDPVKARENEGWQVLSTFEAAVDLLVSKGIADSDRLGLYGWSHGAFVVEFVLAHSKRHFKAASVGEGGDYNPGGYWMFGTPAWPAIYVNTFGGPLTANTAAAYLEFSPVLNVDKIRTPLLMEFVATNGILGFEMFVPLRELRVPAELVLYDAEEHNFVRPTVRFASMHRKIDWFNFWINGQEDNDPEKVDRYRRWRQLRSDWERRSGDRK